MTIDDIRKLIELVRETGTFELEVQWGENRVKIRSSPPVSKEVVVPAAVLPLSQSVAPAQVSAPLIAAPPIEAEAKPLPPESKREESDGHIIVKSPIVGTYYDSPSPGADVFVRVGDRVEPKQVLCIIESMKLMNEIESEITGTIVAKHVENGRPVEYGEALFTVRPQ